MIYVPQKKEKTNEKVKSIPSSLAFFCTSILSKNSISLTHCLLAKTHLFCVTLICRKGEYKNEKGISGSLVVERISDSPFTNRFRASGLFMSLQTIFGWLFRKNKLILFCHSTNMKHLIPIYNLCQGYSRLKLSVSIL